MYRSGWRAFINVRSQSRSATFQHVPSQTRREVSLLVSSYSMFNAPLVVPLMLRIFIFILLVHTLLYMDIPDNVDIEFDTRKFVSILLSLIAMPGVFNSGYADLKKKIETNTAEVKEFATYCRDVLHLPYTDSPASSFINRNSSWPRFISRLEKFIDIALLLDRNESRDDPQNNLWLSYSTQIAPKMLFDWF